MKEKRVKDVLESIAQRDVPENINIWPQIATKVERKDFMQTVRTRPALALLLVLLALALFSGVAYAIGRVTGYIPGVGLVNQSTSLRILTEPVTLKREGITVTVSQVVADSDHTFVKYVVDGIPIRPDQPPMCYTVPLLLLPDGSSLELINGNSGGFGGEVGTYVKFETTVSSAAIPADVDKVTFILPCVLPEGTGPENWRLSLDLVRAPENYATPAVALDATFVASGPLFVPKPTATSESIASPQPSGSATSASPSQGSGLYLDKVIELPRSYILVGHFTDAGDLPGALEINLDPHEDLPHMEDGSGKAVTFKVRDDIQPENPQGGVRYWAYEISKPVQGPVTITLDQVNLGVTHTSQFKFDAGTHPQVGQKWEVSLPIHLGKYEYVVDSVEVTEGGYLFKYHSGVDVPAGVSLMFNIPNTTPTHDDSTVNARKTIVEYSETLTYSTPPTGPLTVELTLYETVPLQGPWTLTWTPQNQ